MKELETKTEGNERSGPHLVSVDPAKIAGIQVCLALYVLVPVIYFLPGATDSYWAGNLPMRKGKIGQKRQEAFREKETT